MTIVELCMRFADHGPDDIAPEATPAKNGLLKKILQQIHMYVLQQMKNLISQTIIG
jgi:hypothetical protein